MTNLSTYGRLASAAILAGIAVPSGAADGVGGTTWDIDEIVVTATLREESALDVPYTINIRDMRELQLERQVRTVPDALRDLPGVMIQKTAYGQGSPYIRGFTGLRTLFLIDGIRLNNSTFREGPNQYWNTVDPLSAHRLEVVKGPTSVLYGSDAIGGTVNAISRSYRDIPGNEGVQFRMYARGASAEDSIVLRPEFGYATDRFDIMAAVSYKDFGDLDGGKDVGTQPMTGYEETDWEIKLHYDLAPNQQLVVATSSVDQDDAWRTHSTQFGRSWAGTSVGSDRRRSLWQDRQLTYLQYRASDLGGAIDELVISASYHDQWEEQVRERSDGRVDIQGTDVGTTGLFGYAVFQTGVGTLTGGFEVYHDEVDSWRTDYNADGTLRAVAIQGPVADDATYTTSALFLQDQFALGERTDLTLGARLTRSEADANTVEDPVTGDPTSVADDWNATTFSARFVHRLGSYDRAVIFGGVSQGFRAPNLSDLTRFDTARSNEIETPVSALDPEEFLSYEIGYKYAGDDWTMQLAAYYTDIRDMIIRTPTGAVIDGDLEITKRNGGDGYVQGVELQGRYRFADAWTVFGNIGWMDGEVDTYPTSDPVVVSEPIDRVMPLTMLAGLRWSQPESPWWLEGEVVYADDADKLSTRDMGDTQRIPPGGTPSYTVVHLRSGWRVNNHLNVALAVENLFDEDYRVHGSGVNEPGQNVILTLVWMP